MKEVLFSDRGGGGEFKYLKEGNEWGQEPVSTCRPEIRHLHPAHAATGKLCRGERGATL